MSEASDTPQPGGVPGPETRRLGALVGRWRSEGHVVGRPTGPDRGHRQLRVAPLVPAGRQITPSRWSTTGARPRGQVTATTSKRTRHGGLP